MLDLRRGLHHPNVEHETGSVHEPGFRKQLPEPDVGRGIQRTAQTHLDATHLHTNAGLAEAAVGEQSGELRGCDLGADPREGHDVGDVALEHRQRPFDLAHLHEGFAVPRHDEAGVGLRPEALVTAEIAVVHDGVDQEHVDTDAVHRRTNLLEAAPVLRLGKAPLPGDRLFQALSQVVDHRILLVGHGNRGRLERDVSTPTLCRLDARVPPQWRFRQTQ